MTRERTRIILVAACIAVAVPHLGRAQQGPSLTERLDEFLTRATDWGFAGSVVVEAHGTTVLAKGYGSADSVLRRPNSVETVFAIGSLSKQFTAAALLRLVELGRVDLTAPLRRYLDSVPPDKAEITLHQLLTHTSGLPREVAPDFVLLSRAEYEQRALAAPLASSPGRRFSYSNAGYGLLAAVIERVAGEPFTDFVTRTVLLPAGLRHTGFSHDIARWGTEVVVARAQGSAVDGQSPASWRTTWGNLGSGGIVSSASDLLTWERTIRGNQLLSAASWSTLFTPYDGTYGYAWMISTTPTGVKVIRHDGAWYAFSSEFRRLPADSTVIIVLANRSMDTSPLAPAIGRVLQRMVLGESVAALPAIGKAISSSMNSCAGEYALPAGDSLSIAAGTEGLRIDARGGEALLALNGISAGPADRDSMHTRGIRTRTIIDDVWRGDFTLLRQVTAAARGERYASALAAWRRQRLDSLGALMATNVRGVLPFDGMTGGSTVFADAVFERGSERLALTWDRAGALVSLATENPPLPEWSTRFRATTIPDQYAAYELASNRLVLATCRRGSAGAEVELAAGADRWIARKR